MRLKTSHHRPAIETPLAFRWRADDAPTLNAGMVAVSFFMWVGVAYSSIPKESYSFVIVQGGGGGPRRLADNSHGISIINGQDGTKFEIYF